MKRFFLTVALAATVSAATAQTNEVQEYEMAVRPADAEKNTGRAVLVCPGGGYEFLATEHEGRQFAEWFAANGITAAVLEYRLPKDRSGGHSEIPLADAAGAMRVIRENAREWGVDPGKIGVIGFSAGGHLASTLLTHRGEADSAGGGVSARPDFGILFYPVITMGEATHGGSRRNLLGENPSAELVERFSNELHVTPGTPPTMIFFSDDDTAVPPRNGTMFYDALKANGVPSAFHIFPSGGHGWGFNSEFAYHEDMKRIVLDWISRF